MRRTRPKSKYRTRPRDTAYMLIVKRLDCRVAAEINTYADCYGPIESDHAGRRAAGRKAPDNTCIPLCDFSGEQMRTWLDERIAWTQEQVARYREGMVWL